MRCIYAGVSQTGPVREKNQDAVLIRSHISEENRSFLLAAVCDGVGGLSMGELASAHTIRRLNHWFDGKLRSFGKSGIPNPVLLGCAWDTILRKTDEELREFGRGEQISLGTTLTALLVVGEQYLITQVGDSRCYRLGEKTELLTKDQIHEASHALLQCVGGRKFLVPEYQAGILTQSAETWLLCSDGFWHYTSQEELQSLFAPERISSVQMLKERLEMFCEELIQRGETDNISAAVICFQPERDESGRGTDASEREASEHGL